jgi:hypothetical protein
VSAGRNLAARIRDWTPQNRWYSFSMPPRPAPTSRFRRRLWRWAAAAAVLLLAGLLALTLGLRRYLRSDGFRQLVELEAGRALRSEVSLSPLAWQDTTALAQHATITGRPGAGFTRLEAHDARAAVRVGAVWDHTWHIPRIEVAALTIDATVPTDRADTPAPPDPPAPSPPPAGPPSAPRWLSAFLPNRLQVDEILSPLTSLRYSQEGTSFRIDRANLTLRPDGAGLAIDMRGGRGVWNEEREFTVDSVTARIAESSVFLTEAQGRTVGGGTMFRVTGEAGERVDLRVVFENMGAAELLSEDWKRRLQGKVSGVVAITGAEAAGTIDLRDGRLELLPVLDSLAAHTKNDAFRRLTITRAQTRFRRAGGRLELSGFSLDGPTLRLTGGCRVEDGRIDGTFEVGIAPGTLRWVPGAESRVFAREEGGFRWTTMRVVGPVESPAEDLSERLVDAAVAQTIEEVPNRVIDAAGQAVGAAKDLGDRALETGGRVLEKGGDLLRGFVPLFK